jgi:hypothetical protein
MLRRCLFVSMLVLLVTGAVRPVLAFDAGDAAEPMDQYQMEYKRQNLGTALGIDQNTVERLLQIDQKYRTQKRQAFSNARAAFQKLQRVMNQPQPPENEVTAILNKLMKLRQEKLTLEQNQLKEEKSILTPVQQAKYILMLMSMRHQVAREAQRVRSAPQVPLPAKPASPPEVPVSRPGGGY